MSVLGPFVFLFLIQFTKFKCGGLAVGLNWAHVLGDAVSASNSLNLWGNFMDSKEILPKYQQQQQKPKNKITPPVTEDPLAVKKVEPAGDFWLNSTKVPMASFSIEISESNLKHLQSKVANHTPAFEAISAIIWQNIAKIRLGKEPSIVTIIRNDTSEERKHSLGNKLIMSTAATDSSVAKLDLSELAMLISNSKKDEEKNIEEIVEKESGKEDFIVYGANLTFVDMQGIDLFGLKVKGQKPAHVDYTVHGVGEEGAILVLPGPDEGRGRVLTLILPEDEILKLKEVIASKLSVA